MSKYKLTTAVAILAVWSVSAVAAPPSVVTPFDEGTMLPSSSGEPVSTDLRGFGPGLQAGADHIISFQCLDGGWGWPHTACPTATANNITAPIALGLLHAYSYTGDPDHLAAAVAGGDFDLTFAYPNTEPRFSAFTSYFLWQLSQVTSDPTYANHAASGFFDELDASTYGPADLDTAAWIAAVQAARTGTWVNLRPWEFHNIIPAAAAIGNAGQDALFEAAVLDGLNTLDNTAPGSVYSDLIGLAGGVRGLAFKGTLTFTPIASPNHAGINGIDSLEDLADKLVSYQNLDGSWNWHSDLSLLGGATESDKDVQTTAYAILALVEADPHVASDYSAQIDNARDWLRSMQLPDGGFASYPGGGENIEVEGEALNALVPDTCTDNVLAFLPAAGSECVQPGETIEIELHQLNLTGDVRGFQAFAQFDSSAMTHVSNAFTAAPFGQTLLNFVSGDEIDVAAGIDFGIPQPPTDDDALLVTLSFTADTEGPTVVSFRAHAPPSRFTDPFGQNVTPCLVESPTIYIDGTDPVITCPIDVTVECDESTDPSNTGEATATDNLDDNPLVEYSDVEDLDDCDGTGTITRTWTATDCAGNTTSCEQIITVQDMTDPVITCPPDVTIECDESTDPLDTGVTVQQGFEVNPTIGPTQAPGVWYTDRFAPFGFVSEFFDGDDRLKHSIDASDCSPCRPGGFGGAFYDTQGRKYDLASGTSRMSIELYVPTGWDTTGRRMAGFWGSGFDVGDVAVTFPIIEFTSTSDGSGLPRFRGWSSTMGAWIDMGLPTGFVYDAWYTLEIELVGTNWVYTVGDLQLAVPIGTAIDIGNVILQGHNNTAGVTYDIYWDNFLAAHSAVATDNCDPEPEITFSDVDTPGGCPQEKTITRTWKAEDECGNMATCEQIITVEDTTDPVITCPADTTIECDEDPDALAAPLSAGLIGTGATATIVPGGVELHTPDGGAGSAYVRLDIPGGIAVNAITSLSYVAQVTTPGAGGYAPEVVLNIDADSDLTLEGTGIEWMHSGHDPSSVGYVSALDRGDNFLSGDNWPVSATVAEGSFVTRDALGDYNYWAANDARDGLSVILWAPFATAVSGLPTHDIDATDLVYSIDVVAGTSGNFDGMTVIVQSIELNGTTYAVAPATGGASATDNCDGAPVISYNDVTTTGACAHESTITRTWTAEDGCGNTDTCDQIITVEDTTPPVLVDCPVDFSVPADAGGCDAVVNYTEPTATDNCDGSPVVVCDWPSGSTFPQGTTLVTCTATDDCGNASTCGFEVTVEAVNELEVTVELQPNISPTGTLTRCITFELWECGGPSSIEVSAEIDFIVSPGVPNEAIGTAVIEVPCGNYTCITARDKLHTLRRTDETFGIVATQYVADFTGDTDLGGDWLIGGNLNDDNYIDILDFGTFSFQFGASLGADTTCATAAPHSDISGDGNVTNLDFSFILNNFLKEHEANCCGAPLLMTAGGGNDGPVTSITFAELRRRGLFHLSAGDLNNDRVLDMQDIAAFLDGARPKPVRVGPVEGTPIEMNMNLNLNE